MPSISAAVGSSVFGRFGKRVLPEQPPPPLPTVSTTLERSQENTTQAQRPDVVESHSALLDTAITSSNSNSRSNISAAHKRESSVASLASSASDQGGIIKRSASLRSHRSQLSGSSATFAQTGRFSSSTSQINAPLAEDHEQSTPSILRNPSRTRRKLSVSARTLSSKFKSTETLPTLSAIERSELANSRPTTAVDHSRQAVPMLGTPAVHRRVPGERPPLPAAHSFVRDGSSSHGSNGVPLHHITTTPTAQAGGYNPRLVHHQIHQTVSKRMATIDYLRKVHEGRVFYFGALSYNSTQLGALPSLHPMKMTRRANNYMILGASLPTVLDINSGTPLEYLKAFLALLLEFETYQNISGFDSSGSSLSRGRVGQMFSSMGLGSRAGKSRRASTVTDFSTSNGSAVDYLGLPRSGSEATSPLDNSPITPMDHEFQYLLTPHLPFDPDFHTTFATLCDALIDAYAKILDLLASPESCVPSVSETFNKADKHVRKILISNVIREFEDNSRATVKGEVAGLGRLVLGGLM